MAPQGAGTLGGPSAMGTIVTLLMVFLIQNTQNHDTEALQIKLDELNLEEMAEQQLDRLQAHDESLARLAREDGENPLD